ncbi:MAG: metallophosphoesterase [Bacteroidetes bacterium]|nr:metallophosphoesterase [Bacteroidota bacterium]MBL7102754.1 metallophosphoesterase [Bacteroidales bacterium]
MKKKGVFFLITALILSCLFIIQQSCKKNDELPEESQYLSVTFPRLTHKHDLYYQLKHHERSIEMEFSQPIDTGTVAGNITFSDKSGSLSLHYDLIISGKKVMITFHSDFQLYDGWKYFLTITTGLKSTSGESLRQNETIELRTTTKLTLSGSTQRNSIACISDIHMGDPRAVSGNYCWFGKNAKALESFLDFILNGDQVRELVILGDLFDEWLVPYTVSPIDPQAGIHNTKEYFLAIAGSPTNSEIFDKLREIALNEEIELVYVPGNHDMLMTQEILEEIIPGVIWEGDVAGLGMYSPVNGIIMEHGHRYDFFNCPQSLVNPDHILPPGYFISRLYAEGMATQTLNKEALASEGSFEFLAAWEIAYFYTILHFDMTLPLPDSTNILMGGIDGYSDPFSFNGARDMYAANIEDFWPATQVKNAVPVPIECCLQAIWNGHSDLFVAAKTEYMEQPPAPTTYKVVAFGHTHEPMLEVYPPGKQYTSIYANSGSWVNADDCSHEVRTYLIINPAEWTGSDIDVVLLYQYNLDSNSGNPDPPYKPVLISEENIDVSK